MLNQKQVNKLATFYVEQGYSEKEAITIAMYILEEEERFIYEGKEYWKPKDYES